MDRDQLIECLIQDQLEKLDAREYSPQLMQVVEKGFRGFSKLSDEQLCAELARRGLKAEFEQLPDPIDDFDDDGAENDGDINSLLSDFRQSGEWLH